MNYESLLKTAKSHGVTSEQKMWQSIHQLSNDLCLLASVSEASASDVVSRILRNQHAILYDHHYSEDFANHDANSLCYTDSKNEERHGPHWTRAEIMDATSSMQFHPKVNDWDKYVAFNAMYADLCAQMTDEEILRAAYLFYFCDKDWPQPTNDCTKIWDYMSSK